MGNLRKRIERLERAAEGDFETKLRALAGRLGTVAEKLIEVATEHEGLLNQQIGADGRITWPAFCSLRDLGAFR